MNRITAEDVLRERVLAAVWNGDSDAGRLIEIYAHMTMNRIWDNMITCMRARTADVETPPWTFDHWDYCPEE